MSNTSEIFDHNRRAKKIERALIINAPEADFLVKHVAQEMADRLSVVNREFIKVVDISKIPDFGIDKIRRCQNVGTPITDSLGSHPKNDIDRTSSVENQEILGAETRDCDLIFSCLGLHWINDVPGVLHQIRRALRPDGLFLAVLPAQGTLYELQDSILKAETAVKGGAGLRIDPFMEVRQVGDLLTRAGFKLPVSDVHETVVRYSNFDGLIADLRAMAATSCLISNRKYLGKKTPELIQQYYREYYSDADGKLRATFRFVFLSGWAAHESQQKPLPRGSARVSLKSVLEP